MGPAIRGTLHSVHIPLAKTQAYGCISLEGSLGTMWGSSWELKRKGNRFGKELSSLLHRSNHHICTFPSSAVVRECAEQGPSYPSTWPHFTEWCIFNFHAWRKAALDHKLHESRNWVCLLLFMIICVQLTNWRSNLLAKMWKKNYNRKINEWMKFPQNLTSRQLVNSKFTRHNHVEI